MKHHQPYLNLASQRRSSKGKGKAPTSENAVAGPSSRRLPLTPAATQQSTLSFAPPPPPLSQTTDSQSTQFLPSTTVDEIENTQDDSLLSSGPRIPASKRIFFPIDLAKLPGEWRPRLRTKRSCGSTAISWIFQHGMEVQPKEKDVWSKVRYFLCKYCHAKGGFKQT